MRLTMYTDFSLRVLLYLGVKGPEEIINSPRNIRYVWHLEKPFDESSS